MDSSSPPFDSTLEADNTIYIGKFAKTYAHLIKRYNSLQGCLTDVYKN